MFRNLVFSTGIQDNRFIRAVDIRPGEPGVVHHAVLQIDPTTDSRQLDEADPEPGFGGMALGASEPPEGHFLGWTPGKIPLESPASSAWLLRGGSDFVLQVHLPATDTTVRLAPMVGLYFSDSTPTDILSRILLANETLDIPPGATDYIATDAMDIPVAVEVLAAYPHAHFLGRTIEVTAQLPDESVIQLLHVADWDFGAQVEYRFDDPFLLPAGSRVTMRYRYDNSADNPLNPHDPPRRVRFGLQSTDEMASLMLQVRLASQEDVHRLTESQARHTLSYAPRNWAARYDLATSMLHQGRPLEAIPYLRQTVQDRPDQVEAWGNLGVALAQTGQLAEAVVAWQRIIAIDEGDIQAHSNIGNAFMSTGRPQTALEHYRKAASLDPEDAILQARIGTALAQMDDLDGAIEAFERAVALAPDDPGLQQALATLRNQASGE
jgi:Flp pilus assembly protein TadD